MLTSVVWETVSYSSYGGWVNLTVVNAGPAHSSIHARMTFYSGSDAYVALESSTSQCFAFANYSCSLSLRVIVLAALASNSSTIQCSVEAYVPRQRYWSNIGKQYSQNFTMENVPVNDCVYNTKPEPYLFLHFCFGSLL